jgi:hypothetical protein
MCDLHSADQLWLDCHGVPTARSTFEDSKYQYRTTKLIELVNPLRATFDMSEDPFGLLTIRRAHPVQLRNAKDSHNVALPHNAAIPVLDTCAKAIHGI